MAITTVLFDLDGTLLPMDQETFAKAYFKGLAAKLAPRGYDPKALIDAVWKGTGAMVKNTGEKSNEAVFWDTFCGIFGEDSRKDLPYFEDFYKVEFQNVRSVCGFAPEAAQVVHRLKDEGYGVILATNPIFPAIATESRIRWAGLAPEDFGLYTTYENSRFCKPNTDYYQDILDRLALKPEECLMVGNDVTEDMVAGTMGMEVFLLTDCLINKDDTDLSRFPHGGFAELNRFLDRLLTP